MKKIATLVLSATLLSSFTLSPNNDPVLATYKGGEVKESQVMEQFKSAFQTQPNLQGKKFSELDPNLQETLVRGYINSKLLEQEAKNSNIENSKEFQEKLTNIKNQLLQQEVIERHIKATVTDSMIDSEYDKMSKDAAGREEVKASHILVETEDQAKAAKKKLSKGAKFADVAKEYSKDEGSKASGGSIGYFTAGQLVPEFEAKAFSMKVGEISGPIKTQFGWHIIKVEDKRPAKVPSKEEAKANLVNKLNREAVEKFFADLGAKADIKVNLSNENTKEDKIEEDKK